MHLVRMIETEAHFMIETEPGMGLAYSRNGMSIGEGHPCDNICKSLD